jgi:hypothetical protein
MRVNAHARAQALHNWLQDRPRTGVKQRHCVTAAAASPQVPPPLIVIFVILCLQQSLPLLLLPLLPAVLLPPLLLLPLDVTLHTEHTRRW